MKKIDTNRSEKYPNPFSVTSENEVLQSRTSQLLRLYNQTRPDINFQVSNLASNLNSATVNELIQCNKTISKVKDTDLKLQYKKL